MRTLTYHGFTYVAHDPDDRVRTTCEDCVFDTRPQQRTAIGTGPDGKVRSFRVGCTLMDDKDYTGPLDCNSHHGHRGQVIWLPKED